MTFLDKIHQAVERTLSENALQLSQNPMGFIKSDEGGLHYCAPESLGGGETPLGNANDFANNLETLGGHLQSVIANLGGDESNPTATKHFIIQAPEDLSVKDIAKLAGFKVEQNSPALRSKTSMQAI